MVGEKKAKATHVWARDPNDYYREPNWCSKRLFEVEKFDGDIIDPFCGSGQIVIEARYAGYRAFGSDLVRRAGFNGDVAPFPGSWSVADNIVTNPPFRASKIKALISEALEVSLRKTAMLMPATWMCGARTGAWLETTSLYRVYFLGPRPSMPPGELVDQGFVPGGGRADFAWYVWLRGYCGEPSLRWLRRDVQIGHQTAGLTKNCRSGDDLGIPGDEALS